MEAEMAVTGHTRREGHLGPQKLVVCLFLPFICSHSPFLLPGTKTQSLGLQQPSLAKSATGGGVFALATQGRSLC